MGIYVKTAADEWTRLGAGKDSGGGSSWGDWTIVDAPDEQKTWSAPDSQGRIWKYVAFNTAGTYDINLTGGMYWVLTVGGGGNGNGTGSYENQGQPGLVNEGFWEFGSGTQTVTVGRAGDAPDNRQQAKAAGASSIGDYGTQGAVAGMGQWETGRGATRHGEQTGYKSSITGEELEYAPGTQVPNRPGKPGAAPNKTALPGCVIIATPTNVEQLNPVPPSLGVAPVISAPVSISGPAVQEWPVKDKEGNQKVVYFLPGNTGTSTQEPEAVYSVALGAGVLPGVMVGSGGQGGGTYSAEGAGAGGAGGVIGQGAHVPVILPVQGTATYTVTVGSTTTSGPSAWGRDAQSTTLAVQGQTPFASAVGGGRGTGRSTNFVSASVGGSGGGAGASDQDGLAHASGALGVPGQGNQGGPGRVGGSTISGGGGGYGSAGNGPNGGAGFNLATALNLDDNDGPTKTFLDLVSVDGWIAGGGAGYTGTPGPGGGVGSSAGAAKDHTGSGGGSANGGVTPGGRGGAGAVYIITDAP